MTSKRRKSASRFDSDDLIVRHQQILPRLGADVGCMIGGVLAPAHRGGGLRLGFFDIEVGAGLGLHHQKGGIGFGDEVGDVLRLLGAELVVDLELPFGRLEPLRRVALQDDGKTALGIRIELLQRVQAARKAAEQHLLDAARFGNRFAEVVRRLSCRGCVIARLQRSETAADPHVVLGRFLPEVRHHLRVNLTGDQTAIPIQHTACFVF